MKVSDKVIGEKIANRNVPVQECVPPLIGYLFLNLLLQIVEVGLADRIAQDLAGPA